MRRILVVDDEEALRQVLAEVLEEEGYEVYTAREGSEALRILEDAPVDLILMDVMMPTLGGIETVRRIRERTDRTPPVVLMSAGPPVDARTLQVAFLRKPFELDTLLRTVAASLPPGT